MASHKYSQEELDFIRDNYLVLSDEEIAEKLGRTKKGIEKARLKAGLYRHVPLEFTEEEERKMLSMKASYSDIAKKFGTNKERVRQVYRKYGKEANFSTKWRDHEIQYLKDNYENQTDYVIASRLGKTPTAVMKKRIQLGLKREGRATERLGKEVDWKKWEIDFLRRNYEVMTHSEIGEWLGRSAKAVQVAASRLGYNSKNSPWSESEDSVLKRYYPLRTVSELSYMLNRSPRAIKHRIVELGINLGTRSSGLEALFSRILDDLKVKYDTQVRVGNEFNYFADFVVGKVIFEVKGDYWHCNPDIYEYPIDVRQQIGVERDEMREDYFRSLGYKVISIWENDLINNYEKVKNTVALSLGN